MLFCLRTADTHKPLLISNHMISDYSRASTTLLLKHFLMRKTQFVRDAHVFTVMPDDWKILLSQRRHWINSTVHNPGELDVLGPTSWFLLFLDEIYCHGDSARHRGLREFVALVLFCVAHASCGSDHLLDRFGRRRRKWDMVGWMVFDILAIPIFSFIVTRVVLGEAGKKITCMYIWLLLCV